MNEILNNDPGTNTTNGDNTKFQIDYENEKPMNNKTCDCHNLHEGSLIVTKDGICVTCGRNWDCLMPDKNELDGNWDITYQNDDHGKDIAWAVAFGIFIGVVMSLLVFGSLIT